VCARGGVAMLVGSVSSARLSFFLSGSISAGRADRLSKRQADGSLKLDALMPRAFYCTLTPVVQCSSERRSYPVW
jgi:hypothetical protein